MNAGETELATFLQQCVKFVLPDNAETCSGVWPVLKVDNQSRVEAALALSPGRVHLVYCSFEKKVKKKITLFPLPASSNTNVAW